MYSSSLISNDSDSLVDSCNFINNTLPSNGIIYFYSCSAIVRDCSFINNTGTVLLYHWDVNSFLVDNCYIDDSVPTTFGNPYNYVVTNLRGPFTNNLSHFSTDICQLEFKIIDKSIDIYNNLSLFIIALANIKYPS